jgi:hypothetical protein
MSEIEAGEGWRLLGPDEVVREGDEAWRLTGQKWGMPFTLGLKAFSFHAVRRRIPAKPEPIELDYQTIICNSFNEVMAKRGLSWRLVSNAEQARQLADWLTRYADWREAQDNT